MPHTSTNAEPVRYHVREMQLHETHLMVRYFLTADLAFLNGMGVDPKKLPSESEWLELLEEDFARPIRQRHFYYLVWEADGVPVGHCNINKIVFGEAAYMHLHIWNAGHRRRGCATQLLRPSIVRFFETFQLRELFCEPYALNPAPNRTLPQLGFHLVRTYETTPGWITFHQPVNLWVLEREAALLSETTLSPVNLAEKLSLFTEQWSPKVIAAYEEFRFKVAKLEGDFVWHSHPESDEAFLVLHGSLRIDFRDRAVTLKEGEMLVVPKGIEHKPFAETECHVMLLVRAGSVNTGDAPKNELTADPEASI